MRLLPSEQESMNALYSLPRQKNDTVHHLFSLGSHKTLEARLPRKTPEK